MTAPDLRSDETKAQDERVKRAVAAERERCAKIALAHDSRRYANQVFQGVEIANEIRGS